MPEHATPNNNATVIKHPELTLETSAGGRRFDAVILVGHGSRLPEADRAMQRVAEQLRAEGGYGQVECCYLSLTPPSFDEVLERCVQLGARRIALLPYFLNDGMHLQVSIPQLVRAAAVRHPQVDLRLARHLDFDPLLVQLVQKRLGEISKMADRF